MQAKFLYIGFLHAFLTAVVFFGSLHPSGAQEHKGCNASPEAIREVAIAATADSSMQKACFYASRQETPQPLIVSLHTWSNDYTQKDPIAEQVLKRDYNYIHPDFRGPNYTPEACGSPLVVSDIDDAISYAIAHGNVDTTNIHVMGRSGGGYATLLCYMQSRYAIRSFSAWVPISDLPQWYLQSRGRNTKYATHIALATNQDSTAMAMQEARERSPMYMEVPVERRKHSKLSIYAGIHDGHTGSVPISHSLDFYNKVVQAFNPLAVDALIPDAVRDQLVTARTSAEAIARTIAGRKVHYYKRFGNHLELTIFEGGHEMLPAHALKHIPSQNILAIGDSNGAHPRGWVHQLQQIRFPDLIINKSISGNTVGFNNLGSARKNTLRNINTYMKTTINAAGGLDAVVILLGTNDSKAVFEGRSDEVVSHYETLIQRIRGWFQKGQAPEILIVSPPPYGPDRILKAKYKGGAGRVARLTKKFKDLATRTNCRFVNIHDPLKPVFPVLSKDGVHLSEEGQRIIAKYINQALKNGKD